MPEVEWNTFSRGDKVMTLDGWIGVVEAVIAGPVEQEPNYVILRIWQTNRQDPKKPPIRSNTDIIRYRAGDLTYPRDSGFPSPACPKCGNRKGVSGCRCPESHCHCPECGFDWMAGFKMR